MILLFISHLNSLLDTKPRYDFDEEKTRQLEDLAAVTVHQVAFFYFFSII